MGRRLVGAWVVALGVASVGSAESLFAVEDGVAVAVVVVEDGGEPSSEEAVGDLAAAELLRDWVRRITGAGLELGADAPLARFESPTPFAVDASRFARTGRNVVAVRVDHSVLRELSLGGIVAPVYVMTSD